MKKAKIMLMSIAVLATVGTSLAFKVAKLGNTTYCWIETTTQPDLGECINTAVNVRMDRVGSSIIYYTEKTSANCSSLNCPNVAKSFLP